MKNPETSSKISAGNWITLHRDILSHWISDDNLYLSAWVKIILTVQHSDSISKRNIRGKIIECRRGQSIKSLDSWIAIFGKKWTKQRVRTFFKLIEGDRMVILENLSVTTRLTVCNYNSYQPSKHATNTQLTRGQHAPNTQVTSDKKVKKENNEKNDKVDPPPNYCESVRALFCELTGKSQPTLSGTVHRQIKSLEAGGVTIDQIKAAIQNAINNDWVKGHPTFLTLVKITEPDTFAQYLNISASQKTAPQSTRPANHPRMFKDLYLKQDYEFKQVYKTSKDNFADSVRVDLADLKTAQFGKKYMISATDAREELARLGY